MSNTAGEYGTVEAGQTADVHSFVPKKKVQLGDSQWAYLLRHVYVELITLQNAGRPLQELTNTRAYGSQTWKATEAAQISIDPASGRVLVKHSSKDEEDTILDAISSSSMVEPQSTLAAEKDSNGETERSSEIEQQVSSPVQSEQALLQAVQAVSAPSDKQTSPWMQAPLTDQQMKLAVSVLLA